jgi:alkanesulfonate monooxygenase SsuD/methylene tetrahydromethanopterin reductase-like flavin-dependent oxidoreductase (luciferase family)
MGASTPSRGLGINAGLDPGMARDLAAHCQRLGYHSLWSNDEPTASGLGTLAHFAEAAPQLQLGVGVLPLSRHQPARIVEEVERLRLDPTRLWLGVGSGSLPRQFDVIRRSVDELRALLPQETRIVVAAMRPRLCQLGGAIADGVLLNWMLPGHAERARRWVQEGSSQAARLAPMVASYVRVAVGPGSGNRLRAEEGRYRTINEGHRKHFQAMNAPLGTVGVAAAARDEAMDGLAPYQEALDLPIVRVLADRDPVALAAVAEAAAPRSPD